METKSTAGRYGVVAVTLHWLSAILILILIVSGFRASGMEDAVAKAGVLKLHVPLGATVLLLTLGRAGWWLWADRKPASLSTPTWQDRSAKTVHLLFYVVIFGMAASGIGMMALSGAGPLIFGGEVSVLPDFREYPPRIPHGIGARVMLVLFVVHVGAALYHHIFMKDGLLKRMWY